MLGADLTFDEASHTYRCGGRLVPGVTSILQPLANLEGIPSHILEAKRRLGSDVHYACQLDDEDDLDEDSLAEGVRGYLAAYRLFRRETGAELILNEQRVHHRAMAYAGTLDRLFEIGGSHWLIDLKTCISTPMAVGPQTAAYQQALGPEFARSHRAALRLRPDGTYRLDPLTDPDDWSAFVACLALRRFKESHS